MTDGSRQAAGRRPDAGHDFSGSPQEGEQLPEEQQPGHPFTSSAPSERSRKAGLHTSDDGDVPDPPATGNPKNAPE